MLGCSINGTNELEFGKEKFSENKSDFIFLKEYIERAYFKNSKFKDLERIDFYNCFNDKKSFPNQICDSILSEKMYEIGINEISLQKGLYDQLSEIHFVLKEDYQYKSVTIQYLSHFNTSEWAMESRNFKAIILQDNWLLVVEN